jgi:uncharacterized repeat protein (TIGR01451 family)
VLNSDPSGFGKGAISVSVAPHGDAGRRVGAVSIGDTSCVVTQLSVLAADLAVSVQPEPVFALLNQPAVYAFTVTNAGPAKAAAARIQFVLPADVAFVRGVGPAGGWSQNGSVVTCLLGDVEATRAVRIAIELTCAIDRATECAVLVGWSGDDPVALNDAAAFVVRGLTPDGDADGDGMRNEDEIRAGTRPDDSVSVLRIVGVRKDGTGLLTVQFRSGSGKTFVVEGRSSLVSGAWEALGSAVNGDGTARDVSGRPTTQRYYLRVRLVP